MFRIILYLFPQMFYFINTYSATIDVFILHRLKVISPFQRILLSYKNCFSDIFGDGSYLPCNCRSIFIKILAVKDNNDRPGQRENTFPKEIQMKPDLFNPI